MLLFSTRREGNEARRPHICGRPCVSKINSERKNSPKTHHEKLNSSPATMPISRRRGRKHVTRVSPYSPDSIYPVFVEIGHGQITQSLNTTNEFNRQNTSHPLAHTRPLLYISCLWKSATHRSRNNLIPHSLTSLSDKICPTH